MLCSSALAAKCLPVCSQIHSTVAGDISCADTAVLWKHNPRQHSTVPPQVTWVNDKLCCSADVIIVVRPCQSTPLPTALVEGYGVNRFQACFFVYKYQQVAAPSYLANEFSQSVDFEA